MNNEMRINDKDIELIKSLYTDNVDALKLLRKVFLPEITSDAPLGQNIDLWMSAPIDDMSPADALINIKARNQLIQHVERCLMILATIAGQKGESIEQTKARLQKNSTK